MVSLEGMPSEEKNFGEASMKMDPLSVAK